MTSRRALTRVIVAVIVCVGLFSLHLVAPVLAQGLSRVLIAMALIGVAAHATIGLAHLAARRHQRQRRRWRAAVHGASCPETRPAGGAAPSRSASGRPS